MSKSYVLDTNVIMQDPHCIGKIEGDIYLPIVVLEELDKHKNDNNEIGKNCREFARILSKIDDLYPDKVVFLAHPETSPQNSSNDVKIIFNAKEEGSILLTNDLMMQGLARAYNVTSEAYHGVTVSSTTETYEGIREASNFDNLQPNEYVVGGGLIERFDGENLKRIGKDRKVFGIGHKNLEQKCALDALTDDSIKLVTINGKAGTGKTMLAIAAGLEKVLNENKYNKVLISRPTIAMGEEIGFLPGPQPLDAKILTPCGWTTMGDLKVGDYVIAQNGKKTKVLKIFPKGVKDIYKIQTSEGSTEACLDHLWQTQTWEEKKRGKKGKIRTTLDIKNSLINQHGKPNHYLPRNEAIEFEKLDQLPIPPYLLGALLGDGSLSDSIVFSNTDSEIIERVTKEAGEIGCESIFQGGINYNLKSTPYNNKPARKVLITRINDGKLYEYESIGLALKDWNIKKSTLQSRCQSNSKIDGFHFSFAAKENVWQNIIKNHIEKLGLLKQKAWDKFIPHSYMYADIPTRINLLRGLMDTDGSCKKNGEASFCTTSEKLANNVLELVKSLGGRARIYKRDRTGQTSLHKGKMITAKRIVYSVSVSLPEQYNPFFTSRKASLYSSKYQQSVAVKNIQYVGKKECQCILIEDTSHLYVTDDYIITHNTIEEKMGPWMQPIFDNIEFLFGLKAGDAEGAIVELQEKGIVKIQALTYIRGRSIPNEFILIDEAQNLTKHEVKTILTRAGENTKIVMVGDIEQIDHPKLDSVNNGLSYVIEKFKDQKIAAHITLKKTERSELADISSKIL